MESGKVGMDNHALSLDKDIDTVENGFSKV